jgi:hypothetical protein
MRPSPFDASNLPLSFEPNKGQADPSVRFLAHARGGTLFFTASEVVLALSGTENDTADNPEASAAHSIRYSPHLAAPPSQLIHLQFLGADPGVTVQGGPLLPGQVNYFLGADPAQWHTDLPTYSDITYQGLYPGVDLRYAGGQEHLKGTYLLAPGADPGGIRWRYVGVDHVAVDEAGSLQIDLSPADGRSASSRITEAPPVAWQDWGGRRVAVDAHYVVAADGTISIALGAYDLAYPLVLDPTLSYSTYLGGTATDSIYDIALDNAGNTYLTGLTNASNFPVQDPYQPNLRGEQDAFVTKLNASGTGLIFSTYLGGSGGYFNRGIDVGSGVAVDTTGNVYVVGSTYGGFPIAGPAFQNTYGGDITDGFVAKLNPAGNSLLYSTYLGGSAYEESNAVALDTAGNAIVTGVTNSTNYPITAGAFQPRYGGGPLDAFVTKLNPAGSALIYSTYLGGSDYEEGNAVALDAQGNVYVTGLASSAFPTTPGAFQPTPGGGYYDGFVTKIISTGAALVYSTYLGGIGNDYSYSIKVDEAGNAYITGATNGGFPISPGAAQTIYAGGDSDAFVTKLNAAGAALVYSTYLGGRGADSATGIAIDDLHNVFVAGSTSGFYPLTADALQLTHGGGYDAFLTTLNPAGSAMVYSTYVGGGGDDLQARIAIDRVGSVYLAGSTTGDFPTTAGAFQTNYGGGCCYADGFVSRIYLPTTDAFAHLEPSTPITVGVGSRFSLDLLINSGANTVGAQQSYLTFTQPLLQQVQDIPGPCVLTDTVAADNTTFETILQNQVCNGPNPCTFGGITAPAGSIAFASGVLNNPLARGDFRVARATFCANTLGQAVIHWQFAPADRNSKVIDVYNQLVGSQPLYRDYIVNIVPLQVLVGHATWQGRPTPPSPLQALPISLTLKLGATEVNYPSHPTDASGFFTETIGGLAPGTYNWRVKGPQYLANSGTVALTGAPSQALETGLLRVGDANNDNLVDVLDFGVLRPTFGKSLGEPGYDVHAEFNGDNTVDVSDFSLLRSNYGAVGAGPVQPDLLKDHSRPATDAFLELRPGLQAPPNGGKAQVGDRFVLELWLQPGKATGRDLRQRYLDLGPQPVAPVPFVAQQSYLSFTTSLLQNVRLAPIATDSGASDTIVGDWTSFDTALQNEVCNGPGSCRFRGIDTLPGSIAFSSAALHNSPTGKAIRIGQIALQAVAPGVARLHWQFAPPDPANRNTALINANGPVSLNSALFADYVLTISEKSK